MDIKKIENEFENKIKNVNSLQDLIKIKDEFLSKRGHISLLLKELKNYSNEEKKKRAIILNKLKGKIYRIVEEKISFYKDKELDEKLRKEKIDVTLDGKNFKSGNKHPLTSTIDLISDIFIGLGYQIEDGPEIEEDLYNFEKLNLPKDHPAREMQDTFYIDENHVLRTHTSPVQIRTMERNKNKPIKIICPGKVYRKDDDSTHSPQFHQIEGLVIDKNITMSDLKGTLDFVIKKLFGKERKIRFRGSYFPFTEPSVEVDISCFKCKGKGCSFCKKTGWIEVLGAGMVHPNVLKMSGFNSKKFQGFAFGIGVERIHMLMHNVFDIKNYYQNDKRFLEQFGGDDNVS